VNQTTVLIVGAGPTGLVLALWLTKLGVRVRIIDKTAEPGTTSRAIAIQARTLELYSQVGLSADVVERGLPISGINLWRGRSNVAHVEFGPMGEGISPFPYALAFGQDEHERLLVERLAAMGVNVERRTTLIRFDQDANGVHALIKGPAGEESHFQASYIAGCDGAHSIVREVLGTSFPGGTYSGLFYVADVIASGLSSSPEVHVELDEAEFLAVFPLKGAGQLRLVGPALMGEDSGHRELSFADIDERVIGNLKLSITKVNWFSTYKVHHRVAEKFRVGRAFLLGDAAHVHSPVGGQGMNTGIGDAVNLSWKLAAVMRGEFPASLLDTYEPERQSFARRLVATTDRAFTFVTKQGRLARVVRTRVVPAIAPWFFRSLAVRRLMFRTVSQVSVNYRRMSALSSGAAGSVQGGDRLPWVGAERGADNFAPLSSLKWQLHVYGNPHNGIADVCEELKIPLHVFSWKPGMKEAGLVRDAHYLVRPDGYVALADPSADSERLREYVLRIRGK
jgi:2-polyprenyl-6-methoxyphenol hydroxylase-like FAD-dependent oxidoreductase